MGGEHLSAPSMPNLEASLEAHFIGPHRKTEVKDLQAASNVGIHLSTNTIKGSILSLTRHFVGNPAMMHQVPWQMGKMGKWAKWANGHMGTWVHGYRSHVSGTKFGAFKSLFASSISIHPLVFPQLSSINSLSLLIYDGKPTDCKWLLPSGTI